MVKEENVEEDEEVGKVEEKEKVVLVAEEEKVEEEEVTRPLS